MSLDYDKRRTNKKNACFEIEKCNYTLLPYI